MFSPEFDQVYEEAFNSVTGGKIGLDHEDVQTEYKKYGDATVEALLDHWTSPRYDHLGAVTPILEQRADSLLRIRHPSSAEFDEEDARAIAKIRFLGRTAIDVAKLSIKANPSGVDPTDPARFNASIWRRHHRDIEFSDELGLVADAASPSRLLEWPKGEYINCLGISIAAAGDSAFRSIPYKYINRIRHNDYETRRGFNALLSHIDRIAPHAYESEVILHDADKLETLADSGKGVDDANMISRCLLEAPNAHIHTDAFDSQFHHAVLRLNNPLERPVYEQFDPYALVKKVIPAHFSDQILYESVGEKGGTCNEILLVDSGSNELQVAALNRMVDAAMDDSKRLASLLKNYKSGNYFKDIYEEILREQQLYFGMVNAPAEQLLYEGRVSLTEQEFQQVEKKTQYIWAAILLRISGYTDNVGDILIEALELNPDGSVTNKNRDKHVTALEKFVVNPGKAIETVLLHKVQNDTRIRNIFTQLIGNLPMGTCMRYLEGYAIKNVYTNGGTPDQTMEIGDPAFQIGSMYLNHYATFRKDGKVNVAKEIARYNPSQHIWQAAVSGEGDATQDPRVRAVGSLVKSLKHDQQHPLVRSTYYKK